jgi:hypothetical protein
MKPPFLEVFGYAKDGKSCVIAMRTSITAEFAESLTIQYERLAAVLNLGGNARSGTSEIATSPTELPLPRVIAQLLRTQPRRCTRSSSRKSAGQSGG